MPILFFYLLSGRPLLIAAAIIPAIWLLSYVYKMDRLEKESKSMLLSLVIKGIFATIVAIVLETVGGWITDLLFEPGTIAYSAFTYFVVVAFSEEGAKYFFLKRKTWNAYEFNCQFDGIVYACFVSLGFALWENVGYVLQFGLGTALVRAATAVPGHACFGVFMGAWYGMAKRLENSGRPSVSALCRKLALIVPALIHGCYDFIATIEGSSFIFIAFVAVMFLAARSVIKKESAKDQYI